MTAQFVGELNPQDDVEQKAKELIEKYMPKNLAYVFIHILVGKFDGKGCGAELAGLVTKQAKLGAAVFA